MVSSDGWSSKHRFFGRGLRVYLAVYSQAKVVWENNTGVEKLWLKEWMDKVFEEAVKLSIKGVLVALATSALTAITFGWLFVRRSSPVLLYWVGGMVCGVAIVVLVTFAGNLLWMHVCERRQTERFVTKTKGFLDFKVDFLLATKKLLPLLAEMSKQQQWMTKTTEACTRQLQDSAAKGGNPMRELAIGSKFAKDVNRFSRRFEVHVFEYRNLNYLLVENIEGLHRSFPNILETQIVLRNAASTMIEPLRGNKRAAIGYREAMLGNRGASESLNDAIGRYVAVADEFIALLGDSEGRFTRLMEGASGIIEKLSATPS